MFERIQEEALLSTPLFHKQGMYWENKLSGDIAGTTLSFNGKTGEGRDERRNTEQLNVTLPGAVFHRLLHLGKGSDLSIYIILCACLQTLVFRYTANEDIIFISPVNMRRATEETLNRYLFIRTPVSGRMTFKELLLDTKKTVLEGCDHQDYPMDRIVEHLFGMPRERTAAALISDITCALNSLHTRQSLEKIGSRLSFWFEREEDRLVLVLSHDTPAYPGYYARQISNHFVRVLEEVTRDVDIKISDIPMLSEEERNRLLFEFNDTCPGDKTGDKTIACLFEERVEKNPDHIALIGISPAYGEYTEYTELSYRALNHVSNQLAFRLREKGVKPDTVTAVKMPPLIEMVAAVWGVIKAGGAFLPIDPGIPAKRSEYMLNDSNATVLVTLPAPPDHVNFRYENFRHENFNGEIVNMTAEDIETSGKENTVPHPPCTPSDLLYVIYTSGTTGRPRGVPVKNENLMNYVNWFSGTVDLTTEDRTVLTSSFAFDLGYTTIFPSLLSGCRLHVVPPEIYLNPGRLTDYIRENRISYMKVTPSFFSMIVNDPGFTAENSRSLRLIVMGGEEINLPAVEKAHLISGHLQIMNHYGPTESTIGCAALFIDFHRWEEYKKCPVIGRPISNTRVYIVDRRLDLLPVGVPGELGIGGAGVARGYLNHPERTAESFTPLFYRTGDIARWLPEGAIEFLGRADRQVKVRGYRIELEEIVSQLLTHENVKDAAVVVRETGAADMPGNVNKHICAYIVPRVPRTGAGSELDLTDETLTRYLSRALPEYMLPTFFIHLTGLPLTPNGKLDKKALPEPAIGAAGGYIAPANEVEEKLAEIWADILEIGKETISADSNFFQLGGQSLKATVLGAKIHKEFNRVIPQGEIFNTPTLRGLADLIDVLAWADGSGLEVDKDQKMEEILL